MLELELATALFKDALLETKVYGEYIRAKQMLKQDETLWSSLQEYRRKKYEMQQVMEGEEMYSRLETFEREEKRLREDERIACFLDAELALCRMMQEIFYSLVESLDFE